MDTSAFLNLLMSTDNPVLPGAEAMRLTLHGVWAIVLGSGALLLAGLFRRPYRLGLSLLVMAWTLVPGSASPAYWLGLAFQTPSLTSATIGLVWLWRVWRPQNGEVKDQLQVPAPGTLGLAGIALGWVLLADAFAWLPFSVYAWGFSSAALGAVAVLATLLWIAFGGADSSQMAPGRLGFVMIFCVLTLFVLTRLPTGNVWDAVIDPWLWLGLQACWLINALSATRA